MKKLLVLSLAFLSLIMLDACKKDPKNQPDKGKEGEMVNLDVQVVLPVGSTLNLSKTKLYNMGKATTVGADGKAAIPIVSGSCNAVFLFDETDRLLLMSYVHANSKEISIKTTAQALLFNGLQYNFLPDSLRYSFLNVSATSPKLANYYTQMEQAFKTDPLLLEKRGFITMLKEAMKLCEPNPIDIYGKQQIYVSDALVKSQLQVEKADEENINISNSSFRRAHAFLYKEGYHDLSDKWHSLQDIITFDDVADKNMKVNNARFTRDIFNMLDQKIRPHSETTGPINLILGANEKDAKYVIRIVGPGQPVSVTWTDAETEKLTSLYYDYLAYDILAPYMLDALAVRGFTNQANQYINMLHESNISLKGFRVNVGEVAKNNPEVLAALKSGDVRASIRKFSEAVENVDQSATTLISAMFSELSDAVGGTLKFPTQDDLLNHKQKTRKTLDFLEDLLYVSEDPFILLRHDEYKEMEAFNLILKKHDIEISPKKPDVMVYTNETFTVDGNPITVAGEETEFEWKTTGGFGVFKYNGSDVTTITKGPKSVTFYANNAPNERNTQQVIVTAYIVNKTSGNRTFYGSDTATVNVMKTKRKITPADPTLSPKNDIRSVKLYLQNADGKDPLAAKNDFIDFQVHWSTSGSYGHFSGGVTQKTTTVNSITYTATDDEVEDAVENITATLQFRQKLNGVWGSWYDYEAVKGKVKINNEPKKKIYWVALKEVHTDSTVAPTVGNCKGIGVAYVDIEPDAIKYSVRIIGTFNNLWDGVHTWTPGNHPAWWIGYGHPRGITGNQYTVAASITRSRDFLLAQPNHDGVPIMGMAEVTVWLK